MYSYYDEDLNLLDEYNMPELPRTLINLDYGILTSADADEIIDNSHNNEFSKVDYVDFNIYK